MDYKRKRAARLGDEGMEECAGAEEEHTLIERPPGVAANIWAENENFTRSVGRRAPEEKRRRW